MAWTADILTTTLQANALAFDIVVAFTDGTQTKTIPFNGLSALADVDRCIQNQFAQYERVASLDLKALVGPYVRPTPSDPLPPTPEMIYAQKRAALLSLKVDLDAKLIDQAAYDVALADVKKATP